VRFGVGKRQKRVIRLLDVGPVDWPDQVIPGDEPVVELVDAGAASALCVRQGSEQQSSSIARRSTRPKIAGP
jgi:hypothetical protein